LSELSLQVFSVCKWHSQYIVPADNKTKETDVLTQRKRESIHFCLWTFFEDFFPWNLHTKKNCMFIFITSAWYTD